MKLIYRTLIVGLLVVPALVACKPTEAGYKAAYDAALAKRQAEQEDAALYGGMQQADAPHWRKVGSDSVLFIQRPLARLDDDSLPVRSVNVVVASYKMPTNAKAQTERLRAAGRDARVLRTSDKSYLVVSDQLDSLANTPKIIEEYIRSHPSELFSGLPGRPIVVAPSGRRIR